MSMTAKFYTFDKRRNSTKTPTIAGLTSEDLSIVLKSPTSYKNPSLHVTRAAEGFPFNYMDWSGWLYWIYDVVSVGDNRYEIRCSLDVLGTLRPWILQTTAFVLYDETANSELPDGRLSVNTSKGVSVNSGVFQYLGGHSFPGGTIVAGIITDKGASFYEMDGSTADDLLDDINDTRIPHLLPLPSISWEDSSVEEILDGIAEILDTIGQNFVLGLRHILGSRSAADCIISAKQLPVLPGAITGTSEPLYLGTWNTGHSAKRITNRIVMDSCDVGIPWTFSDWRRNAPYTEIYLYIPFVGLISLSPGDLVGTSNIHITASLDVISGDVLFEVQAGGGGLGGGQYIGQYGGNIAGAYAIGSSSVSIGQQVVTAIGATAAGAAIVATGGAAAVMAAKIGAAGIAGIIASNTPTPSSITGGGGGASLGLAATCYCISVTHDTNVAPASVSASIGTPAMAQKALSGLTGFVQTKCASVSAPFYQGILDEVNAALDGGVFIE